MVAITNRENMHGPHAYPYPYAGMQNSRSQRERPSDRLRPFLLQPFFMPGFTACLPPNVGPW